MLARTHSLRCPIAACKHVPCLDFGFDMKRSRLLRSERLLQALSDYRHVLVVMHDNPDPDAIAAGWGIAWSLDRVNRASRPGWWAAVKSSSPGNRTWLRYPL